jgi:hypothetical protein
MDVVSAVILMCILVYDAFCSPIALAIIAWFALGIWFAAGPLGFLFFFVTGPCVTVAVILCFFESTLRIRGL